MKRIALLLILLGTAIFIADISWAEEAKPKCLEGIEFLSGFAGGKLRERGNYYLTPLIIDFDFNLSGIAQRLNFCPKQLLQFQIEPFVSFISRPNDNIETGTSFLFKAGILPQTFKFQPYLKGGVGIVYMSQHTHEQSTQFNFTEQVGIGIHFFFRKNAALTLESRWRHLSNASIKQPNEGLHTRFAIIGIAYRF